jgi:hypothetical protein
MFTVVTLIYSIVDVIDPSIDMTNSKILFTIVHFTILTLLTLPYLLFSIADVNIYSTVNLAFHDAVK